MADLVQDGVLHQELGQVFHGYTLYTHQVEAITLGAKAKSFIVTSGTGFGKSVTFLGSVFNHLFQQGFGKGIQAVLVYPMNALINSQEEELKKFAKNYQEHAGKEFPVRFAAYTGQTKGEQRDAILENPPDILLTNYMMLELILTRHGERNLRDSIYQNLRFLVFDELHTYRGRQCADVSLLIRRIRGRCNHSVTSIGTSAATRKTSIRSRFPTSPNSSSALSKNTCSIRRSTTCAAAGASFFRIWKSARSSTSNTWISKPPQTARPSGDLTPGRCTRLLEERLGSLDSLRPAFDNLAEQRCIHLVEAHERFSSLVEQKRFGVVYPVLPMDVLGVYVLMPS